MGVSVMSVSSSSEPGPMFRVKYNPLAVCAVICPPFLAEILLVMVLEGSTRLARFFPLSVPFAVSDIFGSEMSPFRRSKRKEKINGHIQTRRKIPKSRKIIPTIAKSRQALLFFFSGGLPTVFGGGLFFVFV